MSSSVTARNGRASATAGAATWISVHTSDPGVTGAGEVATAPYARKQTVWGAPSAGAILGSQVSVDVPSGGPYTHYGIWSASSAGIFYEGGLLSTAETFGGVGILRITPTLQA